MSNQNFFISKHYIFNIFSVPITDRDKVWCELTFLVINFKNNVDYHALIVTKTSAETERYLDQMNQQRQLDT